MKGKEITITFVEEWFNNSLFLVDEPLIDNTKKSKQHSGTNKKKQIRYDKGTRR